MRHADEIGLPGPVKADKIESLRKIEVSGMRALQKQRVQNQDVNDERSKLIGCFLY